MSPDNNRDELVDRINSLEALLIAREQDADAGLALLAGKTDPASVRRTLGILNEAARYSEAADLIRGLPPHAEWVDKAIFSLVSVGDKVAANELLLWSKSHTDLAVARRCSLSFAQALYRYAFRSRGNNEVVLPGHLTDAERFDLAEIIDILAPLITMLKSDQRVRSALDATAAEVFLTVNVQLANLNEVKSILPILGTWSPFPLIIAQVALQLKISVPEDTPTRIRNEHHGNFWAQMIACRVEGEICNRPNDAFHSALDLAAVASDAQEREELYRVLNDLAQHIGQEALSRVDQVAPSLLTANERLDKIRQADRLLRQGRTDDAAQILNSIRDDEDAQWLQLKAYYLLQRGEEENAAKHLIQAARLLPHPLLLAQAASWAYRYELVGEASEMLEILLTLTPLDKVFRTNLASIYLRTNDFNRAADHLRVLHEQYPDDIEVAMYLATVLAQSGSPENGLLVYESICQRANPPIDAVFGRAMLLRDLGRIAEAYSSILPWKAAQWENPDFLSLLLELSFAAQEETTGHEALFQLRQLQSAGQSPEILQERNLNDFIDYINQRHEQHKTLNEHNLRGMMPWLTVDYLLGHASYLGWAYRTQSVGVLSEDPIVRTDFSIYATNGFAVQQSQGRHILETHVCPSRGTTVVADLSALITLHQLGILDKAASYFGKLLIPSTYMSAILDEAGKLTFHQLSQKTSVEQIKRELDANRINVANPSAVVQDVILPYVSEYTDEDDANHPYRLQDLLNALYDAGRVSDSLKLKVGSVPHKPAAQDENHRSLRIAEAITIELSTLRTLTQFGLLDATLSSFNVSITPQDRDQLAYEARAFAFQEDVAQWHKDLWDTIRHDTRFVQVANQTYSRGRQELNTPGYHLALDAVSLAEDLGVSLLADDRVCQTLIRASKDSAPAAFGTDCLLAAMGTDSILQPDEVADAFLKLVRWRYRFIVVPSEVLVILARRFASHLPGYESRDIALYIHDCMRDLGLSSVFVATDPPVTMANRLFQAWSSEIAEFLVTVWFDQSFSEEAARSLTTWAIHELLPSSPVVMGHARAIVASVCKSHVFSHSMILLSHMPDKRRANACLIAIAEAFGFRREDYMKTVVDTINGI